MERKTIVRGLARMVLVLLVVGVANSAYAVGTAANTAVDNRATVNYSVGTTAQPLIESSPTGNTTTGAGNGADTTFVVDDMVDLTVAEEDGAYSFVAAGGLADVLSFTVTNTGNATHDFSLSTTDQVGGADPFGGTDNFNATGAGIFVDVNDNGVYESGTDTATFVDELAADADVRVFVVRDIPGGQADGDVSAVALEAQVAAGGGVGVQGADILTDDSGDADDPTLVQVVFADGAGDTDAANDGAHSDTDAYSVGAASITVSKTSAVLSDPVNGATNPKAIPGAVVEYTITIANDAGASATATNVQVADSLNAEITAGTVAFNATAFGPASGLELTAPNVNGGVATALTNAADADQGSFAGNNVAVTGVVLQAGESATVRFQVTIQ